MAKLSRSLKRPLLSTIAVAVGLTLIASSSSSAAGGKQISIGLLTPLTGNSAADGKLMQQGAQLAINELNAAGGVAGYKLKLKVQDVRNQETDAVASSVRTFLADSSVKMVLTGYASGSNFEIEPLAKAGMPYLVSGNSAQTAAIIAKNPKKYGTIWSTVPSYDAYGSGLPPFIEQLAQQGKFTPRNRSVYIVTSENPYSKGISEGLAKTFKSIGWKIVGEDSIPFQTVTDWGATLTRIRDTNPDMVINTDYQVGNEATFMKQFSQNPTKSLVFMQYGPSVPEFIELAGKASDGVLYNMLGGPILSPKYAPAQKLIAKFKAAYGGADPGVYGIALYQQIMLYAEALRKVKNPDNKAAIGVAIGGLTVVNASGTMKFDPKTHLLLQGDAFIPLQIIQITNGQRILISPPQLANGAFKLPSWLG